MNARPWERSRMSCSMTCVAPSVVLWRSSSRPRAPRQAEPDGVMTVKFKDPVSAQACVIVSARPSPTLNVSAELTGLGVASPSQKMNGRFFAGRRIEASLFNGRQRFKRGGHGDIFGEGDEKQRLDDFAQWLMAEGE